MNSPLLRYRHWLVLLWIGAFLWFHAPWTAHPTAAFTLNAFDLAEQIGLHPAIRAEVPPLRSAGLLRLALPFVAAGVAWSGLLYADSRWRWLWRLVGTLIALRTIPPEALLRSPSTLLDSDYGLQLTVLTGLGLLLVAITIPTPLRQRIYKHLRPLQIGLALGALILPLPGYQRGVEILGLLGLDMGIGLGLLLYAGMLLLILGISISVGRFRAGSRPTVTHTAVQR